MFYTMHGTSAAANDIGGFCCDCAYPPAILTLDQADSGIQVLVSLSADDTISHHVTYPERRIKLDAEHRSVLIGRSSKASTKNLLALPSNAWFDSPVMSRNHAEITANLKERVRILCIANLAHLGTS